jgi:NACalpha-BTF3-like transcription factor
MCYTGLILIIVPEGMVAYWAGWQLLGLTKSQYSELHTATSLLFLLASILHIYLNWKAIVQYMKNKAKNFVLFTPNFIAALIITSAVFLGAYYKVSPFSDLFIWQSDIDDYWADRYGEPPFGHAELVGLKNFTKKLDLDFNKVEEILKSNSIVYDSPNETILQIAKKNNMTPQDLYLKIKDAKVPKDDEKSTEDKIPAEGSGLGNKSFSLVIEKYGLDREMVAKNLKKAGVEFNENSLMKDMASQIGVTPIDLFMIMKKGR